MSISSGSIVGADGVPTAKLILRVESGAGDYDATFCLNREANTTGGALTFNYNTLIPQKVGCDINVAELIDASVAQTFHVLGLDMDGQWVDLTLDGEAPEAAVTLDLLSGQSIGCFNRGTLTVTINSGIYCDIIVCAKGGLVLPPCKTIQGCENFCVYISRNDA